jgi:hypothetical protein
MKKWYLVEIEMMNGKVWKVERFTGWSINRLMAHYWNKQNAMSVSVKVMH